MRLGKRGLERGKAVFIQTRLRCWFAPRDDGFITSSRSSSREEKLRTTSGPSAPLSPSLCTPSKVLSRVCCDDRVFTRRVRAFHPRNRPRPKTGESDDLDSTTFQIVTGTHASVICAHGTSRRFPCEAHAAPEGRYGRAGHPARPSLSPLIYTQIMRPQSRDREFANRSPASFLSSRFPSPCVRWQSNS